MDDALRDALILLHILEKENSITRNHRSLPEHYELIVKMNAGDVGCSGASLIVNSNVNFKKDLLARYTGDTGDFGIAPRENPLKERHIVLH